MFITFEGGEGCGKSTQAKLLKDYLESKGKKVKLTREPGGTTFAEKLREVILSENGITDSLTEFLLLTTARRDHVINFINPALLAGEVVISDRFFDSSFVYQGYLKGLSLDLIESLTFTCIDQVMPQMTIFLNLDPEIGMKRVAETRGAQNYYDKKDLTFHIQVNEAYLDLAKKYKNRFKVIDASGAKEQVFGRIKSLVDSEVG